MIELTKEFLVENYAGRRLSTYAIAKVVGCHDETIRRRLKKYYILVRSIAEANTGKKFTLEHCRKIAGWMAGRYVGFNSPCWRDVGSKCVCDDGYVLIKVEGRGWVSEHRYIIEQQLSRRLNLGETVHHINEVKDDNRVENLMLFVSSGAHRRYHRNSNLVKPEEIVFDGGAI